MYSSVVLQILYLSHPTSESLIGQEKSLTEENEMETNHTFITGISGHFFQERVQRLMSPIIE